MRKTEEEKLRKVVENLRQKRINDKKKYNALKSKIIQMRRQILKETKMLEEEIKDIMYVGDKE